MIESLKNHTVDLKQTVESVLPKNCLQQATVIYAPRNLKKTSDVVKFANNVKPAQVVGIVDCAKSSEISQIKNLAQSKIVSKIELTALNAKKSVSFPSSSCLPGKGLPSTRQSKLQSDITKKSYDFKVQNRLKINDNSKKIGGKWVFI